VEQSKTIEQKACDRNDKDLNILRPPNLPKQNKSTAAKSEPKQVAIFQLHFLLKTRRDG